MPICYGNEKSYRTPCGHLPSGPSTTNDIYQVSCEYCLEVLAEKNVGKEPGQFKQDNPLMQGAALLQGIEGMVLNLEDGIVPSERTLEATEKIIEQLKLLHKNYLPESW